MGNWLENVMDPNHTPGMLCPACPHDVMSHGSGEALAAGCDHCDCDLAYMQAERLARWMDVLGGDLLHPCVRCPRCGEVSESFRDVYNRFGTVKIIQYSCRKCGHMWDRSRRILRFNNVIKDNIFREALAMTMRWSPNW